MQARNRTWLLGSDPVERCRQRAMPIEGGDGSTLNLDFTTGVLDPRLTFSRGSNATFVNSQGYVRYAGANMFPNSAFNDANPTPSGWNAFQLSATATITIGAGLTGSTTTSGANTIATITAGTGNVSWS